MGKNRAEARGSLWRWTFASNKRLLKKIIGCIDQRVQSSTHGAIKSYAVIDGGINFDWQSTVGYRAVRHCVISVLEEARAPDIEWTLDVRPDDPIFADTSATLQRASAGAAPASATSATPTHLEASNTKVPSQVDSRSEISSSKASKKARLTAMCLPGVTLTDSEIAARGGGVAPQHCEAPSWLLYKAIKLLSCGEDGLDDNAREAFALRGAPPLHSGPHSKTWMVRPKGQGCSAPCNS